jgi:hypothetical protein
MAEPWLGVVEKVTEFFATARIEACARRTGFVRRTSSQGMALPGFARCSSSRLSSSASCSAVKTSSTSRSASVRLSQSAMASSIRSLAGSFRSAARVLDSMADPPTSIAAPQLFPLGPNVPGERRRSRSAPAGNSAATVKIHPPGYGCFASISTNRMRQGCVPRLIHA